MAQTVYRCTAFDFCSLNPLPESALDLTGGEAPPGSSSEDRSGRLAFQVSAQLFFDTFAKVDLVRAVLFRGGEVENSGIEVSVLDVQRDGCAQPNTGIQHQFEKYKIPLILGGCSAADRSHQLGNFFL